MRTFFLLFCVPSLALAQADKHFDAAIAPLLARRCLDCHDGPKPKGGLDLKTRQGFLKGGKNGIAAVPGKVEDSLLWEYVDTDRMPPKKPLSAAEKTLLKTWIAKGATWGTDPIDPYRFSTDSRAGYDWWSLQPVVRPPLPNVKNKDWAASPIDMFILAQLEAKNLAPSPQADRRTLIRRVTFDLIGLPPTPAQIDAFVADDRADAYPRLVERLLASPHYGERWARHWLDIVRFGESHGFEHDELRTNAWPYRDWVIEALNEDMPYDEFARLQLAGDVLRPNDPKGIVATGFLVAGGYDSVGQRQQSAPMRAVVRQDELEDIVGTTGQTFLGLTVHCARCHDHKFDPVRQTEYYRLTAAFAGVRHGQRDVTPESEIAKVKVGPPVPLLAYACTPRKPEPTHFLVRGEPGQKGTELTAGGVAALTGTKAEFGLALDAPDAERRRALAAWIASPENPLFARVMVNRLWQYHFGAGLVETPSDFGFSGGRPSHPELIDYLAAEFITPQAHGLRPVGPRPSSWSLKHLHYLLVTSKTYQQQSRYRPAAAKLDANNRLLWRKTPMRLEAEAVRDTILHVSGQLNTEMGGPGYQDFKLVVRGATHYYNPIDADSAAANRRSIYRTWARSGRSSLLDTLDCPDPSTVTPKRTLTTTPLQALALMNNAFVLRMADHFADRLRKEAGANVNQQIIRAYQLAYGRMPADAERALARGVVERQGLAVLCRAIFNSNEFMYVD